MNKKNKYSGHGVSTKGCKKDTTLFVAPAAPILANFTFNPEEATVLNPMFSFTNQSTGGTIYSWNFAGLGTSAEMNPHYTFVGAEPGTYNVCLNVSNVNGCNNSVCKNVVIGVDEYYFVPSAFTPNDDKGNDLFFPVGESLEDNTFIMSIYDRWGVELYTTRSTKEGWDGTYGNKPVQDGVYIWKVELIGSGEVKTGKVSLLK